MGEPNHEHEKNRHQCTNVLLKHAIGMKKQSFIFFTITYELNDFKC